MKADMEKRPQPGPPPPMLVLVNPGAGRAEDVIGLLKDDPRVRLQVLEPGKLTRAVDRATDALFRGIDPLMRARQLESHVLEQIVLGYRRPKRKVIVAVDGELIKLTAPLQYRFAAQGLVVVTPPTEKD